MDIETVLGALETLLRGFGFSEQSGALLVQLHMDGKNYIRSYGDLNNLATGSTIYNKETNVNFIDFIEKEIHLAGISSSTKGLHRDTYKLLKKYMDAVDIRSVNTNFLQDLEIYMREQKGLSVNTIARHMKVIKRYLNVARKKEIIQKDPFLHYAIRTEETHRDSLSEKELELLERYREQLLEPNEILNAFLFSCYTGLRFSDVREITKQEIRSINGKKWLIVKMHKTNIEVRIPVSTIFDGKALLLSKSISKSRGRLFLLESNQKTNRTIKSILKKVGVKRNISFHCARHTFATLLIYRGVAITTIQKLLGHKSVKTTQIYSAVTDLTVEKELKRSNTQKKRKQPVSNKRVIP